MKLLEFKRNDYDELAKYLAIMFNQTEKYWIDRFHLFWDLNPAFSEKYERGFVLKDGLKIIGFIGKFPTKFVSSVKEDIAWN